MESDFTGRVDIVSEETVAINGPAMMISGIAGKNITLRHIKGPPGVGGRSPKD
jgi:hypothetical protein